MRYRYLWWAMVIGAAFALGATAARYYWLPAPPSMLEPIVEGEANAAAGHEHVHAKATYVCPMHPDVVSDKPGTCPVCGMALVQAKLDSAEAPSNAEPGMAMPADKEDMRPVVRITPEVINNLGVKTAPVTRTTLRRRIDTPGFVQQIQPGQTKRVTAPFAGRVVAVSFTPRQWLEPGQALLVLESETLRTAELAHLALLEPSAPQGQAHDMQHDMPHDMPMPATEVAAVSPAGDSAMSTASQPLTATLTLEASRRSLAELGLSTAAIQHLEQSREASAQLTLSAPYAAMVSNPQVEVGVTVDSGALLFELTGMARASVLANAFQRDAAWIQTGQPVEIRMPHVSGTVWPGVVNQGAVSIDPNSQNIGVRLSFSAPTPLLKSAMYVVASILGDPREGVLAVPQTALIRTEHEDRVIVAQGGGRFQPVPVSVGIEADGQAEIISGLKEGDEVVTSAQFLIDSESSLQSSFLRMSGQVSQ